MVLHCLRYLRYTVLLLYHPVTGKINTCPQSLPNGVPSLVKPSLEKQDIPQMKKDLPKYDAAGVYSREALQRSEKLLEDLPRKYGTLPECTPHWIVHDLRPINQRITSSQPSVVIPEKVTQKAKAIQEHQQVNICLCWFISLSHYTCTYAVHDIKLTVDIVTLMSLKYQFPCQLCASKHIL